MLGNKIKIKCEMIFVYSMNEILAPFLTITVMVQIGC